MRRAEMARRRRNLSEKRNEEVKVRRLPLTTPFTVSCRHCPPPFSSSQPPPAPLTSRIREKALTRVQRETINKLLKKQAPKTTKRAAAPVEEEVPEDANRPDPTVIRWISDRNGSRVALPEELVSSRVGAIFRPAKVGGMVEEVQ